MFWLDGGVSEQAPKIEINDRGLLLGDAVFDTSLTYRGKVVFARQHEERLAAWLATVGIDAAPSALAAPYAALSQHDYPVCVRVTVTRGSGPRGIHPPTAATPRIFGSAAPLAKSFVSAPVTLCTSNISRNSTSISSTMKTADYVDAIQAMRIATLGGYDDALFLNEHGNVACSTIANLFIAKGDQFLTPPVSDGVVPGVIRAILLEVLGAREKSLTLADLRCSDGVLLTNSLRLVSPVMSLDGMPLNSDAALVRVQDSLFRAVRDDCGLDLARSDYLFHPGRAL